ncbi:MAG: hypothetical protein HFH48_00355 [Lachnospiraceae bacterium]|nr:hypothetical protein [Lachnospiraceae bacterium]
MRNCFYETIPKEESSIKEIEKKFKKRLQYASMGRFGIYHILRALKESGFISNGVMMPVYACDSIDFAVRKAGFRPVCYDICGEDLNGDLESIKKTAADSGSKILLLPSLYGNPADLAEAENFCKKAGVFMIDDGAQSFGACLDGKMVGTFGDSGLFSFSAGKPTFGHMGCYFWTNLPCHFSRTHHWFYHRLTYFNYFFNRYGDYNSRKLYRVKLLNYLCILMFKILDIADDDICGFEEGLLAKIGAGNIGGGDLQKERIVVMKSAERILQNSGFRLVKAQRGISNNNKLVLIAETEKAAEEFMAFMKKCDLHCAYGYQLLDNSPEKYPIADSLYKKVIEIPIVADSGRNKVTLGTIKRHVHGSIA